MLYISFDLTKIGVEGLIIAFVGYIIVFVALVILVYVFNSIPKILNFLQRRKERAAGKVVTPAQEFITADTSAAISMALYLFMNENHDEESNKMTIKRISETYTPWSSKIYGLRTYFKPHTFHR